MTTMTDGTTGLGNAVRYFGANASFMLFASKSCVPLPLRERRSNMVIPPGGLVPRLSGILSAMPGAGLASRVRRDIIAAPAILLDWNPA
jgi:hypothetical protein